MPRTTKIDNPPACYEGTLMDWKALSAVHQYRIVNKDKKKARNKIYRTVNKDRIKRYAKANKDVLKAYLKKNYQANKTKMDAQNKIYRAVNKDKIRARGCVNSRKYRIKKAKEFYELFGTWEIEPGIY